MDASFSQAHDEVFEEIDCLDCANCCKTTSPMFFDRDIERLASHLNMSDKEFEERYLYQDGDGIMALKETPCPFLGEDNYCSVYSARPKACREYPHTNQRKMVNKLKLAEKNASICPAIEPILQRVSASISH